MTQSSPKSGAPVTVEAISVARQGNQRSLLGFKFPFRFKYHLHKRKQTHTHTASIRWGKPAQNVSQRAETQDEQLLSPPPPVR